MIGSQHLRSASAYHREMPAHLDREALRHVIKSRLR
jgi:hypothetical protein